MAGIGTCGIGGTAPDKDKARLSFYLPVVGRVHRPCVSRIGCMCSSFSCRWLHFSRLRSLEKNGLCGETRMGT